MTPASRRPGSTAPILLALIALHAAAAAAQQPPSAPASPQDVLGWELGEQFTDVASLGLYFRTLERTSPLVSVHAYGQSWEGLPLIQVLIASAEHRARLDEILALNRELTDPATSEARAREIIASGQPVVLYYSYGVHGNESSSSEAAMWTAWDLVREAPEVADVLDSAIVVIDPALNPDGRERYVDFYRRARGAEPDPDPAAREHSEPWPGGRYNHYLFDLNRDWSWLSQIETRARASTWDRWNPQVHIDFHEMGYNSSYFFFPAAEPFNPIYPETTLEWGRIFGDANAAAFDREGWLYYTAETYDHFYPGYGDTWPALLGAIGMTYEQAGGGGAGLVVERPDGTLLTLRERAQHHRVTGRATAREAAQRRSELLADFAAFHRGVGAGQPDFLLVAEGAPSRARALVDLLLLQGVEVERAGSAFEADARPHEGWDARQRFPAGTYRVRARQPRGRLAVTLLQAETVLDATFSYDISAWSLPYGFGVEAHAADELPDADWTPITTTPEPTGAVTGRGAPGYLVAPTFAAMPAFVDFLEAGGRASVIADTFRIGGRAWPAGTLFLPRGLNEGLDGLVAQAGLGAWAEPVTTLLTPSGPDLGTEASGRVRLPRVALLGGEGTSASSFGAHWYFLDHRLGLPFDAINVEDVGGVELSDYDVIVVPSAFGLSGSLGEGGMERLLDWVRDGGALVAVAGGARAVADAVDVAMRESPEEELARDERLTRALRTGAERDLARWEADTPGAVLPVRLDPGNPLAFGAGLAADPSRMFVLSTGASFEPTDDLASAAWFPADVDEVSGVISPETLARLGRSSWMVRKRLGAGSVVLFADDPLFRIMWYAGFQPYVNSLLLAPTL